MNPIIDTNVSLSRWPFRRLKGDEPAELVTKLRSHGVVQAWAGSFDGLFHRDLAAVNARLAEECRRHGDGLLVPFGSVNPLLPDWEEDLRRCHEVHRMAGVRLHPNYHGYRLDHAAVPRLLAAAAKRGLVVQLTVSMEDERTQNPVFRVPHVDVGPLADVLKAVPGVRLELLNAFRGVSPEQAGRLMAAGEVYVEIAMLEGAGGVARLLEQLPPRRVLFGSHFPLFYYESAVLKLKEADLGGGLLRSICEENARGLLKNG